MTAIPQVERVVVSTLFRMLSRIVVGWNDDFKLFAVSLDRETCNCYNKVIITNQKWLTVTIWLTWTIMDYHRLI